MKIKFICVCLVAATAFAAPALAAEGRTPIYQAPYVVPAAGRYIVTQGLTGNGTDPVITIGGNGVESVDIDLNGFQLTQPPGSTAPVIRLSASNFNTIHGGIIYGGTRGVETIDGGNSTFEDLTIRGATGAGILPGAQSTIRRVKILNSGAEAIDLNLAPKQACSETT